MERWVVYAIISMIFAGFTSVIAKQGLVNITGELGLVVRTCFVFLFVIAFAVLAVPRAQFSTLSTKNLTWLGLSGITTAVS
jgi:transporter family protein